MTWKLQNVVCNAYAIDKDTITWFSTELFQVYLGDMNLLPGIAGSRKKKRSRGSSIWLKFKFT